MSDDYEYFKNKRPDRVYLSRTLSQKQYKKNQNGEVEEFQRPFRVVSKVIDSKESHEFFKDGKQISLRVTDGARQEIVAKFYEDTRQVFTLQIQRYTVDTGAPHNTHFTFINDEISVLYNFLQNIELLPLRDELGVRLDDRLVSNLVLTRDQALNLLNSEPELLGELVRTQITARDVAELGRRRTQLVKFSQLLNDPDYFRSSRDAMGPNKGPEAVWQAFFEKNTWIFGYGLNYVFNSPLDDAKLEQAVKGHDIVGAGKRVDALLKTQGLISALSFGEIKTHTASLLKPISSPYRAECWQISDEISGGIAQVQRSVQSSLVNIRSKTDVKDQGGAPTGEQLFLYQPRSFLVIGSLSEFRTQHGINEEKYSSFELFRRAVTAPEIITFDELYERAKFIVEADVRAK